MVVHIIVYKRCLFTKYFSRWLFLPLVAPHIVSLGEADQYHVTLETTVLRVFVEEEARHFVFPVYRTTVPNHTPSIYQWSGNYLGIYLNEILLLRCMQNFIYPPRIQYFSSPPSIYSIRQPCCAVTSLCCAHTEPCVPFALNWRVCHYLWNLFLMNANKHMKHEKCRWLREYTES